MRLSVIFSLLLLVGCASVGGVTIYPDDTIVTVLSAFIVAVVFLITKSFIEYQFNKALERYKKRLDKK